MPSGGPHGRSGAVNPDSGVTGVTSGQSMPVPSAPPAARLVFGDRIGQAEAYAGLLAGPGVVRGLLGPREVPRLWDRHILNSAVIAELVPRPSALIDLGSGAGLPGIVLALLLPDVSVTLLERMARRSEFLRECVRELGLVNVRVVEAQAEEVAGLLTADVVTARAVAPLARLAPLALALVRPGGLVLAIKGAGAERELTAARRVLRRLRVQDAGVIAAGGGKVDQAATVVRLIAGP